MPDNEKDAARRNSRNVASTTTQYGDHVYVRTNSPESGLVSDDLKAILQKGIDGIVCQRSMMLMRYSRSKSISSCSKRKKD